MSIHAEQHGCRIRGRYVALGRLDNVNNHIMTSHDIRAWDTATVIQEPERPWELMQLGFVVARQMKVPIVYKGRTLKSNYRLDLLVDGKVIVDIKAVDALADIHHAQVLTYLRHSKLEVGLLINFNSPLLRDGINCDGSRGGFLTNQNGSCCLRRNFFARQRC